MRAARFRNSSFKIGVFQYRERWGCKEAERKIKETVECAMLGTMPRLMAMRAKARVDPWFISKPTPAGAQPASCSISTRCKGGNLPRLTGPWGIKDGFDADLFVTSA